MCIYVVIIKVNFDGNEINEINKVEIIFYFPNFLIFFNKNRAHI